MASAKQLVERAMQEIPLEDEEALPKTRNIERVVNRLREGHRPKHPADLNFEV
jgi:hypothetical protein